MTLTEWCQMTIRMAVSTIVCCTLFFAGAGATGGYLLGEFAPGYYRTVFHGGREPGFDPVGQGVMLGLWQGIAAGFLVGVALVAIVCWRKWRQERNAAPRLEAGEPVVTRWTFARVVLLVTGTAFGLVFCLCSGVIGVLMGEQWIHHRQYVIDRQLLTPVLARDQRFAGVYVAEYSGGGVALSGTVPTANDRVRLRSSVEKALGPRGRWVPISVTVDEPQSGPLMH